MITRKGYFCFYLFLYPVLYSFLRIFAVAVPLDDTVYDTEYCAQDTEEVTEKYPSITES